jgi:hypothetical protein
LVIYKGFNSEDKEEKGRNEYEKGIETGNNKKILQ